MSDILTILLILGFFGLIFNIWWNLGVWIANRFHIAIARILIPAGVIYGIGLIFRLWHDLNLPFDWLDLFFKTFEWWYIPILLLPSILAEVVYTILTRPRNQPDDQ